MATLQIFRMLQVTMAFAVLAVSICGCTVKPLQESPGILCTIAPLDFILAEITAGVATTGSLLRPSDSPHTYTPGPADAAAAALAKALFYVSSDLDGWIAQLESPRKIAVLELLDHERLLPLPDHVLQDENAHHNHHHGHTDPHFWSDPLLVARLVPALLAKLIEVLPDRAPELTANAQAFVSELETLDQELRGQFAPFHGMNVAVFHPSWMYFFHRYGIAVAAVIEPSPGKELSPKTLQAIVERVRDSNTRVILSEPQLAPGPARAVADATGLPLVEIDPLGAAMGARTYAEFIRGNAAILAEALS